MPIEYIQDDIFKVPSLGKKRIIPHICNDIGGWGSGFVVSLSKVWKEPEQRYRFWFNEGQYIIKTPAQGQPVVPDPSNPQTELSGPVPVLPDAQQRPNEKLIPFKLGMVQYVPIPQAPGTIVCNMIAQHGVVNRNNPKPIRYAALVRCMERIETAVRGVSDVEIHAPKFGSGLAGGNWDFIEELIKEIWLAAGLKVVIYDYTPQKVSS